MKEAIFLCHSSEDKSFVRKLAFDLHSLGLSVWLDEWEIKIGESLHERISEGILSSGWFIVVLSKTSVESNWVKRELNAALVEELERRHVFVLPLLLKDCDIPLFLKDKLYADFRKNYRLALNNLLNSLIKDRILVTHRIKTACVVRSSKKTAHKIGSLISGQPVRVFEKSGLWRRIVYFDHGVRKVQTGWVRNSYLIELEADKWWRLRTYADLSDRGG